MASTKVKTAVALILVICVGLAAGVALRTTEKPAAAAATTPGCAGPAETFGNMTLNPSRCTTYGFFGPIIQNATLDNKKVLPYISAAYEYHLVYMANSTTDPGVTYAVLNVTGSQQVSGNWSSGYSVSYVGNKLVNVTVLHVVGSVYEVAHVSSYSLPTRSTEINYTAQQGQTIETAFANSSVTSLMGGKQYYVELVAPTAGPFGDAYVVELYQVDGTGVVGADINAGANKVTDSFTLQRIAGNCWPDGVVISDPWGALTDACLTSRTPTPQYP